VGVADCLKTRGSSDAYQPQTTTAKTLGVSVPSALLAIADEVIE